MIQYSGKSMCGGIAVGKIHLLEKRSQPVEKYKAEDCGVEIRRFETARAKAQEQLA